MFKVLAVLAVVAILVVALFVVKRVVPACRLSCGLDSFWSAQKRRSRVVVTVRDDDMPCGVDALNVEGVVKSVAVRHGELTICMLGAPPLGSSAIHPVVQFSFKMENVQDFSVGERPMLHRLEWREHEGFAYVLRFTSDSGPASVDEAVARVKARGGSCWGVEEAAEHEWLLGEHYSGK